MAGPALPWEQYREPSRARQPLSREVIVDTALRVVDEQGLAALSMRAVAQVLGTGPASLYAHVDSKEQLVDLLLDRVYGEFEIPAPDPVRWQEQIREFVRSALETTLKHPGIATAMLGAPPMGPNGLRLMEGSLALLRAARLPDAIVAYAGELIGQYIAVNALERETNLAHLGDGDQAAIDEWIAQFNGYLQSLPADQFPHLVEMVKTGEFMNPGTNEERFELGLEIIIRGLASFQSAQSRIEP